MTTGAGSFSFGVFEFDAAAAELRRSGRPIKLAPQPSTVLALLLERHGHVVTRAELKKALWGDDTFVDFDQGLNFCVRQIRDVLGDDADQPRYIETLPRRGYRFIAPVGQLTPPADVVAASPIPAAETPASVAGRGHRTAIGAGAALVILAAVATYGAWARTDHRALTDLAMVAVLPFENLSGDESQRYFSDGVTDEIATQLGRLAPDRLGVIARTSARAFRDSGKTAAEFGREIGVQHLVEGTVQRAGNRVRISAELIRVRDQSHVWAETYEGDLSDILALQHDIGHAIARQVTARLSIVGGRRPRGIDPAVYDLYLKGRLYWSRRSQPELDRAIESFEEAARRDPAFALAFAGLADCYNTAGDINRGYDAAEQALSLDDRLAEVHSARAHALMHMLRWEEAETAFQRAVELDPSYPPARYLYAEYLVARGRGAEAKREALKALVVDPLSAIAHHSAGVVSYYAGDYDGALPYLQRALDLDPQHNHTHARIAMVYERRLAFDEAIAAWERANRPLRAAYALARGGRTADARRIVAEMIRSNPRPDSYDLAAAFVGLGEYDEALKWLATALRTQTYDVVYMKVDPRLEPLRGRPEFLALLKEGRF